MMTELKPMNNSIELMEQRLGKIESLVERFVDKIELMEHFDMIALKEQMHMIVLMEHSKLPIEVKLHF
jgi:hypothetical protein